MKGFINRRMFGKLIAGVLLSASFISNAQAAAPSLEESVQTAHVSVTMVSERSTVAPGDRLSILLQQKIIPGWHTYWRNPGDSGQPPQITWRLPPGAHAGPIQWPAPQKISVGPLVNYGYANSVGLISDITVPPDWPANRPFPVLADVTWLVCADICVPEQHFFALSVPTGTASVSAIEKAPLFNAARTSQPTASPWRTTISGHDGMVTLRMELPVAQASQVVAAQFFPDDWGVIDHAAKQQYSVAGGNLIITTPKGDLPPPAAAGGIVTISEKSEKGIVQRAYSFTTTAVTATTAPLAASQAATNPQSSMPLMAILLSALVGGMLLNLMPCVFPILAMKALALVTHAAETPRRRIAEGAAYLAGILLSFAILGGSLLILKTGGSAVGWGFQLQNPALVAMLSYILFAAALNLSGMFEISGRFMGMGSALASRSGVLGSFFVGMLAAIVATPCTAPFMAGALGVALTQPAPVAMATFEMLGLGLGLPYLLLSLFPTLGRALPKPGAWMNTFKQVLAFPMYASAAWLVWVLAQQTGADGVFAVLLGMVAIAFAIWLWRLPAGTPFTRMLRAGSFFAVLLGSMLLAATVLPQATHISGMSSKDEPSEPFTHARLVDLRAAGKPVFVNLTAAWCITCKVNERIALSGEAFHTALKAGSYTYLKGDWTRQDPEITQMLTSFGRAGVPLYVVYPPNGGRAEILPQILTQSIVLDALKPPHLAVATSGDTPCNPPLPQPAAHCSYRP